MNEFQKQSFLSVIYSLLKENPAWLPDVIQVATKGVTDFAEKQRDETSHMSILMLQVLELNSAKTLKLEPKLKKLKNGKIGRNGWSKEEYFKHATRCITGTPGEEMLRKKFNIVDNSTGKNNNESENNG